MCCFCFDSYILPGLVPTLTVCLAWLTGDWMVVYLSSATYLAFVWRNMEI